MEGGTGVADGEATPRPMPGENMPPGVTGPVFRGEGSSLAMDKTLSYRLRA